MSKNITYFRVKVVKMIKSSIENFKSFGIKQL